jgi:hypothetical protein
MMTGNQQPDEGLHDCARGQHCAARKTVLHDGKHVTVPAQTYRAFCDADVTRIRRCLNDLPRRFVELAVRIGDKTRSDGPRVSGGGASAPIPINTGVEAFQQQITEILTSWEERVRDAAQLADVSGQRRAGHAVKVACAVLAAHVDALLALPPDSMCRTLDLARHEHVPEAADVFVHDGDWLHYNADLGGVEAGIEILNLHHRALARLGWTPQHHDLRTPCWDCDVPRLRRWDGTVGMEDHVACRNCGSEYLGDRLRMLMVDEEKLVRKRQARQAS